MIREINKIIQDNNTNSRRVLEEEEFVDDINEEEPDDDFEFKEQDVGEFLGDDGEYDFSSLKLEENKNGIGDDDEEFQGFEEDEEE